MTYLSTFLADKWIADMYCVDTMTREGRQSLGIIICSVDVRHDQFVFGKFSIYSALLIQISRNSSVSVSRGDIFGVTFPASSALEGAAVH
jgi:hypothetical protein